MTKILIKKNELDSVADLVRLKLKNTITNKMSLNQINESISDIIPAENNIEDLIISGNIVEYSNESITSIQDYKFAGKKELISVEIPVVKSISQYAFEGCENLEVVYAPNITTISSYAFKNCHNLSTIDTTNITTVAISGFYGCWKLPDLSFPNLKTLGVGAFSGCEMAKLDFSKVTSIPTETFWTCKNLSTLILRSETMVSLSNTRAFNSTPFGSNGSGGIVYVPSSLIESYQTATNWSTLYTAGTCNFMAIEGSEYE